MRALTIIAISSFCGAAHGRGLQVGDSHVVHTVARPSRGIEAGMPRSGPYARGIRLDRQLKWNRSYRAYAQAHDRYRSLLAARPSRRSLIAGWIAKAKFQMVQSSRMISQQYMRGNRHSAARLYDRANTLHNKYLAIRAYTGEETLRLRRLVIGGYRQALRAKPAHRASRLGLATFYHELGLRLEARRNFARLIVPTPRWLSLEMAHYYAAASKPREAMDYLRRAIFDHHRSRIYAFAANHFDPLRDLPAFQRLMRR